MRVLFSAVFTLFFLVCAKAQDVPQSRNYPQNVFRYPIDLEPETAGSFGELRPNHFHSGLDFRTNQRTGYPVHAAYDGYVSRIRSQIGGFGYALYIAHPNGFTSVYAHLDRFSPAILKAMRDRQKQEKSFAVDFPLDPFQIPVRKNEVVAWSGNTGASGGPHLHFELRDSQTEATINPSLFGLRIPDSKAPTLYGFYVYDLGGKPFNENTPKTRVPILGSGGSYKLAKTGVLNLSGEAGFGLIAYDFNSASANRNGIYSIQLNMDGKTYYTFAVERFAFDQTHAINAHIDYPAYEAGRTMIQKAFVDPGNRATLYPVRENNGRLRFDDGALHDIEILVKDVAGNTSALKFRVKAGTEPFSPPKISGENYFRWNQENVLNAGDMRLRIPEGNLYDDVQFSWVKKARVPGAFSDTYKLHNRFTPVHDSYELWIKPDAAAEKFADKLVIVNERRQSQGGAFENGMVKGNPKGFGEFYLLADTVPPLITPINIADGKNMAKTAGIYLRIGDNLSGIKKYEGFIDGEWVLFEYNFRNGMVGYAFDETLKPGKHELSFRVVDGKDNAREYTAAFYR
ncbi:MAG: M23 family metallopeptidase [Mucilaginibacter polytrichastri]|nr:M23 family metallopeptidase [Mucilaginibacter polytrichastri]